MFLSLLPLLWFDLELLLSSSSLRSLLFWESADEFFLLFLRRFLSSSSPRGDLDLLCFRLSLLAPLPRFLRLPVSEDSEDEERPLRLEVLIVVDWAWWSSSEEWRGSSKSRVLALLLWDRDCYCCGRSEFYCWRKGVLEVAREEFKLFSNELLMRVWMWKWVSVYDEWLMDDLDSLFLASPLGLLFYYYNNKL